MKLKFRNDVKIGLREKVSNISVPLSYSEELYHLRMHIDLLRGKLKLMIEKQGLAEKNR